MNREDMNTVRQIAISTIIALGLGVLMAMTFPSASRGEEPPDLFVGYGCFEEQTSLDLAHVWEKKGMYWLTEAANEYLQTEECFTLDTPGYPTYIDRVVKQLGKKVKGEDAYVVEGHFHGVPEKPFFFLYHGEVPVKARRTAA